MIVPRPAVQKLRAGVSYYCESFWPAPWWMWESLTHLLPSGASKTKTTPPSLPARCLGCIFHEAVVCPLVLPPSVLAGLPPKAWFLLWAWISAVSPLSWLQAELAVRAAQLEHENLAAANLACRCSRDGVCVKWRRDSTPRFRSHGPLQWGNS